MLWYESVNSLLTFNQNPGFFKLEHLTDKLRHEVEVLGVTRDPWKQRILVGFFKWVWSGMPDMPKVSQFYLKNELSYYVSFLHLVRNQ